ncbi:aldo/keto reductase [Pseudomarimonas salicorniae]|uniref:Aldo/keto reductase n=1 Tax=Pseudomarimonas salicorniae TaxID=2933270 RepID=A0ABT0GCJ6_9GAMM|nr:aldo/keto reductase [Lysobacter sp. CAU 1642]MCK7592168.1 aldo/keto reductase [Lysobacter sp. CAU 1642]
MQYRRMGRSGLKLSALSLGSWVTFGSQLGRGEARELVARAWDEGVNFFDNAESYARGESERIMGDVIADLRLPRDGFCVSSKVFFGSAEEPRPTQRGLSRKHLIDACEGALRRLRVDYLDLYFCHRPDPDVPVEEIVLTMDALIRQGKVLYWGTSEWPAELIESACRLARKQGLVGPSVEQPQYNLLHRRRVELEYAGLYAEYGIGLTTFSPLASGLLSGKYLEGTPEHTRLGDPEFAWLQRVVYGDDRDAREAQVRRFVELAAQIGESPAQLAIAWCLKHPQVSSVILGARTVAQLEHNLHALSLCESLGDEGFERLQSLDRG